MSPKTACSVQKPGQAPHKLDMVSCICGCSGHEIECSNDEIEVSNNEFHISKNEFHISQRSRQDGSSREKHGQLLSPPPDEELSLTATSASLVVHA